MPATQPDGEKLAQHIRDEGAARRAHDAKYPQHKKLSACEDKRFALNEFMEWYDGWRQRDDLSADFVTCDYDECGHGLSLVGSALTGSEPQGEDAFANKRPLYLHEMGDRQRGSLLAEFFGIDEKKLEAEKRAMLDAIRAGDG